MDDIGSLLGQNKIVESVLNDLREDSKVMIHLEGLSGSGKTYITQKIRDQWEASGHGLSFFLKGDDFYSNREFFPILGGFSNRREQLLKNKTTLKSIIELTKGIPYAGDFVGYIITSLSEKKNKNIISNYPFLTELELDVVFKLQYLADEKELLIIADNFHWFDKSSIDFFDLIFSEELSANFQFLKKIKLLCVTTRNQEAPFSEHIDYFFHKNSAISYIVKSLIFEDYEKLIKLLGLKINLSTQAYKLLFSITGSHIELIKNIIAFVNDESCEDIESVTKNINDSSSYAEEILRLRLSSLGVSGTQIKDLLEQAAIIGLNFSLSELKCLSNTEASKIAPILNNAREINLIDGQLDKFKFNHEILKSIFTCKAQDRRSQYHNSFANCLRILKPSDYISRANNLFEAGSLEKSIELYIVEYFKSIRNRTQLSPIYINRINSLAEENVTSYFYKMKTAYEAYNQKEYNYAISILRTIEENYTKILVIEKDYLLSVCLAKMPSQKHRFEAKIILESWSYIKNEEGELWTRLMSTLMIIYIHLEFFAEAIKLEKEMMVYLSERQRFDTSTLEAINIIRRKSSSLHSSEISLERTLKSLQYFGPREKLSIPWNPIQYYMALTNHAANAVVQGDFDNSYYTSLTVFNLVDSYPSIFFPRYEIPLNNFIISGVLSSKLNVNDGILLYEKIIDDKYEYADKILLISNLAILYALSNDFNTADKLIEKASEIIQKDDDVDSYYRYYVEINRATFSLVQGKRFNILLEWEELKSIIPNIPDALFLKRRHELLRTYFEDEKEIKCSNWVDTLLSEYPFELGKAWSFFGKGYLFSDLQFWSES